VNGSLTWPRRVYAGAWRAILMWATKERPQPDLPPDAGVNAIAKAFAAAVVIAGGERFSLVSSRRRSLHWRWPMSHPRGTPVT
jgi:hypothetical protein